MAWRVSYQRGRGVLTTSDGETVGTIHGILRRSDLGPRRKYIDAFLAREVHMLTIC